MRKKVYAIATETGKYYVGASKNPQRRIRLHFNGEGAKFLKFEEPRRVLLVTEEREDWEEVEKALTLWFAERFGRRNVRGYSWTSTKPAPIVREKTGYPKYPNKSTIAELDSSKLPEGIPLHLYI